MTTHGYSESSLLRSVDGTQKEGCGSRATELVSWIGGILSELFEAYAQVGAKSSSLEAISLNGHILGLKD